MAPALAALLTLYKPHMTCVFHATSQAAQSFFSDTAATPDGGLITQRNYATGFSEIIAIAYDEASRQYVRTQLTSDGAIATATASAPEKGVWTWVVQTPHVPGQAKAIHFGTVDGKLRYWYAGGAYTLCT
ncbi:MAG TPA: hypothetical protein VHS56_07825 [Candidatus Cybelea sp.]|jgi:hypothetical protein|nr:hypothetical protein [Candidatus Cybelea sp.]